MSRFLKIELKRAFTGRYFWAALFVGCILTISDFWQNVYPTLWMNEMIKDYPISVYNSWIGLRSSSLQTTLILLLAPLIASIPYADSYFMDNEGYIKNLCTRGNRRDWLNAKYIAVFLSGGAAYSLSLVANLIITAMYVPAVMPQASTATFAAASARVPFSNLFMVHPLIYVFFYILISFIIVGLFAEISLVVALFTKNRFVTLLAPFVVYMLVYIIFELFGLLTLNPYYIMSAHQAVPTSPHSVVILPIIIFLLTYPVILTKGVKRDVV